VLKHLDFFNLHIASNYSRGFKGKMLNYIFVYKQSLLLTRPLAEQYENS